MVGRRGPRTQSADFPIRDTSRWALLSCHGV